MFGRQVLFGTLLTGGLFGLSVAQTVYEAENATLTGVTVATEEPGYSGTGYVDGFDEDTDQIEFNITSDALQLYDLSIIYAGLDGDKMTTVVLNGDESNQVSLPETTEFTTISGGQVLLNEGSNTIAIVSDWGWYLIDAITLAPSEPRGPHQVTTTPVNPDANSDARALLEYLGRVYGSKILSGQQDRASFDWVVENVGKTPAILGVDFMDYTESRISRGAESTDVDDAISFADQGGIVTFAWHWGAPVGLYDTEEQPWYSGFYTEATDFNITTALADTTNANYTLLMDDIDSIAAELTKLADAEVPVLFRPLHEAEGGWFWWGAEGPEPCKKLYKILYDRLVNHHGLNNIIWMWNSIEEAWYPGDDVVDMVSADAYVDGHGALSVQYNSLLSLVNDTKIIAASEVGSIPDPALLQAYQADWVYFCVWGGEFIDDGEWNSLEYLKSVYNDEYVLTLGEIEGWKSSSAN